MNAEEKLTWCKARKEVGRHLFGQRRYGMAQRRYEKVIDVLRSTKDFSGEGHVGARDLRRVCELNKAACMLKLADFTGAIEACTVVLREEQDNVKALFRRGSALLARSDHIEALCDLGRVLELDPANADARKQISEVKVAQREAGKKSREMLARMGRGLGSLGSYAEEPVGAEGCVVDPDLAWHTAEFGPEGPALEADLDMQTVRPVSVLI